MASKGCKDCERYKKSGHNYCRMCGYHLTRGYVQNVRVAVAYNTSERFCGHCGTAKHVGNCDSKLR